MKHYKNPQTNELYAYEADGSQDAWIKPGLVPVSDVEAEQIRQQTIEKFKAENPVITDPVEKLKAFLSTNPDVAKLLSSK